MKVIQIAPHKEDCKVNGNKVIGTMDGRTFVYEIPAEYEIGEDVKDALIATFRQAIGLCSKPWQVTEILNNYWNISGGMFYEE